MALTTAESYVALILSFALISLLSRLLTPSEIGISVLGNAVVGVFVSLREIAAPVFIIQHKELKATDTRTVVTLAVILSTVISVLLVATGPLIGATFTEPRIVLYLDVAAASIWLESFAIPVCALLRRNMEYGKLASIGILNASVAFVASLLFALLGLGYMSFAWAWLAAATVSTSTILCLCPDRSIYRPNLSSWREVLTFGIYSGGTNILTRLFESVPYLCLGRILALDSLAIYNRSLTICQLPNKVFFGGVFSVLISAFSNHARNGGSLKQAYLRSIEHVTALQWPALIVVCILAHPIVRLILGDQWLSTIPLIQIIALASIFTFSNELNYPLLIACGASRDLLLKSLIVLPASALILMLAAFWGLQAAALSAFIYFPFQAVVSILFNQRHIDVTWSEIAQSLAKAPCLAAAAATGPLLVVGWCGTFDLSPAATVAAVGFSAIGWSLCLWLLQHPLGLEASRLVSLMLDRVGPWATMHKPIGPKPVANVVNRG